VGVDALGRQEQAVTRAIMHLMRRAAQPDRHPGDAASRTGYVTWNSGSI
jgi:hypothetical protein